jgi:outer membrane protein TolC
MYRLTGLLALLAGCVPGWGADRDRLAAELEAVSVRHEVAAPGPSTDPELDRLFGIVDLDALVQAALARNPEIREATARARAATEEVAREGSLDDPILRLQTEATPLRQPTAFNRAMDNTLGLMQTLPFPGNLGLRSEAALGDAEAMRQMLLDRERDVIARLKKAYFEYFALDRELEIHREHARLLQEFEQASDARYRTGAVSQQDVLKPQVELIMLLNEVLAAEQRYESARAAINALLNRPADAPLGRPRDVIAGADLFDLRELSTRALTRPEVLAAGARVKGSRAALELARREAAWPDFGLGVDYWQIPGERDAWGGMFSVNLPWFTGKRSTEVRRREHLLRADEAALEGARTRALFEARDAALRVDAARKSLRLFEGEILPKSAQSVEVSRAGYSNAAASFLDLLDAERSRREVQLQHVRALAALGAALADLERAVGADLRRKP